MKSKTATGRSGRASNAAAATADQAAWLPYGAAHTIALNLPELAAVVARLVLPPASALSPLPGLLARPANGIARASDEVMRDLRAIDPDTATWAFSPLAIPDRILDLRGTTYDGAPQLCRLYSNRLFSDFFAGLRTAMAFDYELLAPFTSADLEVWSRTQMDLSGGQVLPSPADTLTADDLAFLLLFADAYKLKFARSLAERSAAPRPNTLAVADILEAQGLAAANPQDRRWAASAIGELFSAMVHPGGGAGIGLPQLTEKTVREQVQKYARTGFTLDLVEGQNLSFRPGTTLSMWAGSLTTWLNLTSYHDVQVIGYEGGRPRAQEEAMVLVATESTIWAIVTDGLGRARGDLGAVQFGLRSLSLPAACELTARFVSPLSGINLPDEVYTPAGGTAAPAAPAAAPAPPRSTRSAPKWQATHVIPDGGLDTWEKPDPDAKPSDELEEGIEVQVVERLGDWARVVCDNGWAGWIDGRDLVEV